MPNITISYADASFKQLAEIASTQLGLPLCKFQAQADNSQLDAEYSVHFSGDGLSFISNTKHHGAIRCDFVTGSQRHRRNYGGGNGQMIAKAVGVSGKFTPSVLDLTAGLGGDGFVLASLGCQLQLLERNPIVYLLLKDGLARARNAGFEDSELAAIVQRITLLQIDSSNYLDSLGEANYSDIIYMDPMFPPRKKSAQVKKEMQALHQIVGGDDDAAAILEKALSKARYRVVVKRPAHSDFLAGLKPNYSLEGKSTRYDIFALQKIPK